MDGKYVTSEMYLPDSDDVTEVELQITDKATKEIFVTRAKVSQNPDSLDQPESLTVMRGPHENIEEQWYIDLVGTKTDRKALDMELLQTVMGDLEHDSNVINTRSKEAKIMLEYLARAGEFKSVSEAGRSILLEALVETHPELVEAYVNLKVASDRKGLLCELREKR